jgi:hypothetical protein
MLCRQRIVGSDNLLGGRLAEQRGRGFAEHGQKPSKNSRCPTCPSPPATMPCWRGWIPQGPRPMRCEHEAAMRSPRIDAAKLRAPAPAASDMSLSSFLQRLRETPGQIEFADTIAAIESRYDYVPTAFRNGEIDNAAGQNGGSCKIFAFAKLQDLSKDQTLACFGRYYREDVLQHAHASDHQNIRNFMRSGWSGIAFEGQALKLR